MMALFLFVSVILITVYGYNNGVGEKPVLGYSSWYACSSNVTEAHMKNQTDALISTGLADLGYKYGMINIMNIIFLMYTYYFLYMYITKVNVDEGWIKSRASNGTLISDPDKFPSGMKQLGDYIHNKGLKYGLYSSRGTVQCGAGHNYNAPGSYGYYKQDAQYMADAGADYFKLDSCGAVGNMTDAFNQYNEFGMDLNQTGRVIY